MVHAHTQYEKQQPRCMVIKLDVRKVFTRLTTNADAPSVCGSYNLRVNVHDD